jgi:DNA polymerase-3 subunit delta'
MLETGPLICCEPVLRGLWRAARDGRLPHAFLFHGPAGIGKFAAALRLVQGLLCAQATEEGPCGTCRPCKQFLSGNHLDVFLLDVAHEDVPDDLRQEHIRLDRIVRRNTPSAWDGPVIEEFLSLRAAQGGWRAILVREAERLSHSQNEAQNALLKVLEEPGERVLWVLETDRPAALLPTVLSRCVAVRFEPPPEREVIALLEQRGLERDEARRFARWSGGSPGKALALRARAGGAFRSILESLLAGRTSALDAARDVWEAEGEYQGRTPAARSRDQARAFLDLALDALADLQRGAAGLPAQALAHGDLIAAAHQWDAYRLRAACEQLLVARADLDRNLDPQVAVDLALLALEAPAPAARRSA